MIKLRARKPVDPVLVREHRDRLKNWLSAQFAHLEANGMAAPGTRIDLGGESDAGQFREHFRTSLAPQIEAWNRAIVICNNAYKAASTRAAAEDVAFGFAHEGTTGWPFLAMVVDHAGGHSAAVDAMEFEWVDGALCDKAAGRQIHSLELLDEGQRASVRQAVLERRLQTADWPETLALQVAWSQVQTLRSELERAFSRVDTYTVLPGECDVCPHRASKR